MKQIRQIKLSSNAFENSFRASLFCLIVALLITLSFSKPLIAAPVLVDFGFDSVYQDNLSKTPDSMGDSVSGLSTRAFASVRKGFILSEDLSFMMKVGVDYNTQHIDESADYVSANLVLASTYRPFDGFSAPYFKMSLDSRAKNYRNAFGNEQVYRGKFSVNSQLSDTISAQLGLARRIGESEWAPIDTFNIQSWDTDRTEYFLGLDFQLDPITVYAKLSLSDGDSVWTRQVNNGYIGIFGNNVKTTSASVGVNYPLTDSAVIDVLARRSEIKRNGNNLYDINSLSMAFIQRLSF